MRLDHLRQSFLRVLFSGLLLLGSSHAWTQETARRPVVTASFSILADLCAQIGGQEIELRVLVDWDQDPHVFRPSPMDLKKLVGSDGLLSVGADYEPWLARLVRSTGFDRPHFEATSSVSPLLYFEADEHGHDGHDHAHDAGAIDPHWWHSPRAMQQVAAGLASFLAGLKPSARALFEQNAQHYRDRLHQLDQQIRTSLATIPPAQRLLVVPHNAFAYLARDYGLTAYSVLGLSTEESADARTLAGLIRRIRANRIGAVFEETTSDSRLIHQIHQETGVALGGALISGALSRNLAPDYLSMMRYNTDLIVRGLMRDLP
jgi:zinc/manganese transport system substrate-binding protein